VNDIAGTYLQLPLRQWGAGNVYLLVLSSWKVNIAENGVLDTFGHSLRIIQLELAEAQEWVMSVTKTNKNKTFEKSSVLGSCEYLKRLGGKSRECLFFYVKKFKNNCVSSNTVSLHWIYDMSSFVSRIIVNKALGC
jgi:hypothetical protein